MTLADIMNAMPFAEHLGIEVTEIGDGYAEATLTLGDEHSSVPGRHIAHGGVAYALADTVGGAAVMSRHYVPTPTVDMRIDYLAPVQTDLTATADVVRDDGHTAVAAVDVYDADERKVARARGVFKTGGGEGETPWGGSEQTP